MNAITTEVKTTSTPLMNAETFNHMWRVGKVLALSPLFPDHLRKGNIDSAIANGVLVMNMALRLGEDPLTVAQNIYSVGGKPGWSSSYMIGKANQSGRFIDPIDWKIEGEGQALKVTAYATLGATKKQVSVSYSMKTATDEGWTKNAKYKSMPEIMLRYRTATALIRLYCPEVMIGIPADVEVEVGNMRDVTPSEPAEQRGSVDQEPEVSEAETVAEETTAEKELGTPDDESNATKYDYAKVDREVRETIEGGADIDQVIDFYKDQITAMEAEDKERHSELMGYVNDCLKLATE